MKKIIIGMVVLVGVGILIFFLVASQKTQTEGTGDSTPVIEGGAEFSETPSTAVIPVVSPEIQKKIEEILTQSKLESGNIYRVDQYPLSDAPSFVPEYMTNYDTAAKSFTIILYEYPLLETRVKASQAFLEKFSLTEEEACNLNVEVRVPVSVHVALAGKNLGLSFCPNRVDLSNVVDDRVPNEEQEGL